MGYGLVMGFIDHLQVVTTNIYEYNTIADVHTYKYLHARSSPAYSIFSSRCLVTALNIGDFSASMPRLSASLAEFN
jgi:hypothetical protein